MVSDRSSMPTVHAASPRTSGAYILALAALAGAIVLRWLLDPFLGDALPLVTLFGAVAGAVWLGGYRPAVLVGVVGFAACDLLFIPPRGAIGPPTTRGVVGLGAYLVTCAVIVAIGEAMHRAERRARQRLELLRVTLASISEAVITTDVQGHVDYLNRAAEALTGWPLDEALAQPLDAVFQTTGGGERENHTLLIDRQGIERAIDHSTAPILDADGRNDGRVLIFRDVSQRRRFEIVDAERLLAARLLASIVETSDDAIVSKSLDGTIRSWNAGAERLFGYSAEEAVGNHISLVIPADRIAEEDQIVGSLKAGRRIDHFETERLHKNGRLVAVSLTISPLKDEHGTVVGASKIARDITERKQSEAEREKFVTLVESSSDFIGISDLNGVPLFVNAAGLRLVGLDGLEQARRVNVRDFFYPEDQALISDEFLPRVLAHGHGELEIRFRHFKTGAARWMAYKVLGLKDESGRIAAFATVSQDVTERRRLEDSTRALAEDLAEVDRRKNEFLAMLSHELRNPLAPLRNTLEILKRGGDAAEAAGALVTMERQLEQLVRLVDDLLDLNRMNYNRIDLRLARVDLASVLDQAILACRSQADAAQVVIDVDLAREPMFVRADAVRLAQVFGNLLNNGCKYNVPGGTIRVKAELQGGQAVVTVTDTGAGIPADQLGRIFEMFTQLDRSLERTQGGLGIGLTLVKRLVEQHGGTIEARSAGEGKGSAFVVRLPLAAEVPEEATPAPAAKRVARPRRILVVDDNRDAAASLSLLLRLNGHQTFEAYDGTAALEAVEQHRPDVVLLDIGLPMVNGYEVCRRVREQPWGAAPVIVALTGWGQEEDRRTSREAGFDSHLVKPVDFNVLLELLATMESREIG